MATNPGRWNDTFLGCEAPRNGVQLARKLAVVPDREALQACCCDLTAGLTISLRKSHAPVLGRAVGAKLEANEAYNLAAALISLSTSA